MRIGIDLGGTKIEGIAISDTGNELLRRRVKTPRGDYVGTVNAIEEIGLSIELDTMQKGTVGIGIPGTISPQTGLIKNANSTWLIGKNFDKDLEEKLQREWDLERESELEDQPDVNFRRRRLQKLWACS